MNDSGRQASGKSPGRLGHFLRVSISYLVAAVCFYWVFHNVPLGQLLRSIAGVDWHRLVAAVALQFAAYLCVAWEWQVLLRPTGALSFPRVAQAVFAGRFANDVLPVQLGYLIRTYLASRWMGVGLASVLPSLIVERLWDGIWLAIGLGLVAAFVPLPPEVLQGRNVLAALALGGAVLVVGLTFWRQCRERQHRAGSALSEWTWVRRILEFIGQQIDGIRDIARAGLLLPVLVLSLFKLAAQASALLVILWAYGFHLSIWVGLAVFLIGYLGICLPSTPAGAGVFQVFSVAGLQLFGVSKPAAAGFSLLAFVVTTAPIAIAGFFALAQSGMTLRQIRNEVAGLKNHSSP